MGPSDMSMDLKDPNLAEEEGEEDIDDIVSESSEETFHRHKIETKSKKKSAKELKAQLRDLDRIDTADVPVGKKQKTGEIEGEQ